MKIKPLIAVALAAYLTITSAFARIGETEVQLTKRYGRPTRTIETDGVLRIRTYRFNGFDVVVTVINGVSAVENYKKTDGSPIEAMEVVMLSKANAGGRPCSEAVSSGTSTGYMCGDIVVSYNLVNRQLAIGSKDNIHEMGAHLTTFMESQQKKNVSGF